MKGNAKQHLKYLLLIIYSITFISGCSLFGDDDRPCFTSPISCSTEDYNQYVYDSMKSCYYWYDEADPFNQIDPKDTIAYPTPQSLIDVLKFSSLDRFSGVGSSAIQNQFYGEGVFLGVGLRLLTDETTGDVNIAYTFVNSDAYTQGILRGERIVEINGVPANYLSDEAWSDAWGPREVGNEVSLLIEAADLSQRLVTVSKSLITINSTQNSQIINNGASKVAYLHFTNFLGSTAINDLNTAFANFVNNNVTELIVDLRYNGGGRVPTANHLGSLIGGNKTSSSLFSRLIYNNNPQGFNGYTESSFFSTPANALNLSRVFFIISGSSCSASELLINSLIPNPEIDVIVVGSASCGKPVGSVPQSHCGNSLSVINFEIRNSANQGQYYAGISSGYSGLTAFCEATDDISSALGDSDEASISAALSYINNSQCGTATAKSAKRYKLLNGNSQTNRLKDITGYEGIY